MPFVHRPFHSYLWGSLFLCLAVISLGEWLIPAPGSQMVWLIFLIPIFVFSYEFGYKGGISFTFIGLLCEVLITWNDFTDGDLRASQLIRIFEAMIVLLAFAVAISALAHRLHKKRKRLEQMDFRDPLTNLYNRTAIQLELVRLVDAGRAHPPTISCIFIDVDDFNYINDTFGHDVGDECLKEIALRLREELPENSQLCARLGGDEFIVVLLDCEKKQAEEWARNLISTLSGYTYLHSLNPTFSAGISNYPADCQSVTEIFQHSDIAMYQAKREGKNRVRTYIKENKLELLSDMRMEQELRASWSRRDFQLVYQPQAEVASGKIIGLEALLRWDHPEYGSIPPDTFIPILERTDLIVPIGEWVLLEACRMGRFWQRAGFHDLRMAVNISPVQLKEPLFASAVSNALRLTTLSPQSLELEITERIAMIHSETCIQKLLELKDIGIRLAMDDFGSGYSSLNYLIRYPLDRIKLDKEFVQALNDSANDAVLFESLIGLLHRLNLSVVAEGVETQEQLQFCKLHACDFVQGYLIGRPMNAEQLAHYFHGMLEQPSIREGHERTGHEHSAGKLEASTPVLHRNEVTC
ncbi:MULTISPECIES: EAL domain-containing protein [unclassified Paenibacillus]|uniref:EAL domain-containing protein n=1 Tax=unclassified Paenibacillus TaxID=185978 RepID=UPI000956390C|nr:MULTISPECIES: EAL domain-containing protein [unclassified Paenibacillus]ASS66582.1 EAL domain-containing protein [Paenibacillus sp. RUD330]SIQ01795.1 diguanylate cyclase (GGDEF) domain-containing protein [Paenibacillus sp. RU4X]SIQ21095.1 diguanylate cyclase (GGDEF) domain-containing protein [Paenibacillus sp. RU4T]